jgi:hypothetical protein
MNHAMTHRLASLSRSQVIWVCILCRKKQELLSKTGQWINKTTSPDGFIRRIEPDGRVSIRLFFSKLYDWLVL